MVMMVMTEASTAVPAVRSRMVMTKMLVMSFVDDDDDDDDDDL